jgi:1,4-dihydroxy-2-naphthoate octaprenyltransferase
MKHWLLAFRPKTLTAAVVPIFVGTTLVMALGYPLKWWISLFALLASLFIQIGTNLINDAMDFKKGADTHERIGPSRITQQGHANFKTVYSLGLVFFALAFALGIPLVMAGGWPIVFIGLLSLVCGYAYTGGPFPLAYRGLGDLFVILFFGIIAVSGLTYLHTKEWHIEALLAGLQVGCLATVLIAINNFRDMDGDVKANKKTLAVRFGANFVRAEIALLILMSFAINFYWWSEGFKIAAVLSSLAFPMGVLVIKNIFTHQPSPLYNRFLAQSALLHLLFGVLLSLGFAI